MQGFVALHVAGASDKNDAESCISGVLRVTRMHRPRGIIECFRIRQEAQSGCGITTYSERNAGSIRRQLNVENLKIISGWVISFANPPPFRMLKVRGG